MNSKIDQAVGGIKKAVGDVTGNDKLQAEGMAQKTKGQASNQMHNAGQQVEQGKQDMKNRFSGNNNQRMGDNLNNDNLNNDNLNNDNLDNDNLDNDNLNNDNLDNDNLNNDILGNDNWGAR